MQMSLFLIAYNLSFNNIITRGLCKLALKYSEKL